MKCAFCDDTTVDRGIWLKPGPGGRQAPLLELMDRVTRWDFRSIAPSCVHILCKQCHQAMQDLMYALNDVKEPT